MTVGQQKLWLLHSMVPHSSAYNTGGACRFSPGPDLPVLEKAVRAVARRHDMLRSRFVERDGQVVRTVVPAGPEHSPLRVVDLGDADESELLRAATAASRQPYDLSNDGPFRAVLLGRPDDAVLLLGTHHIASDATSQWLIWRDLMDAYEAYATGRGPAWMPAHTGYHDHVAREEDLLASARGTRMREYWRQVTDGAAEVRLPLDQPRPNTPSFRGQTATRQMPESLTRTVRQTAAQAGVSSFALLMGAFQMLLHRYTGQRDFSLVCPASTRRHGSAEVVGYFVNPITLRARIGESATVAEVVQEAAVQLRNGMARAACPYEHGAFRVAMTMVPADRLGGRMQQLYDHGVDLAGRRLTYFDVPHMEGQCDLSAEITEGADRFTVAFRYDTDLFEPGTIERMLEQYLTLTEHAARGPQGQADRVPMVEADERMRLLALGGAR
nr:condensation domain-containing protein [Kineosporia babensis]